MRQPNRVQIIAASCALLAFATIAFTPISSRAQTMGEYGLATGHAAAAGSSMPSVGAPDISSEQNPPSAGGGGGQSQTEEVQTYDAPRSQDSAQDDSDRDSSGQWEQQSGSDK
jgi:hypothetical protein